MKLYYILIGLFLVSCVSKKNISKSEIKKDSIVIVDRLKVDSILIKEKIEQIKPTKNEVILKCDSTFFNQNFKNGNVNYSIKKEKGIIKFIIKTDTINKITKDSYYSKLYKKDSLQKVNSKSKILKTSNQTPSFIQILFTKIWQILFWLIFVLWILNITPMKIIKLIKPI